MKKLQDALNDTIETGKDLNKSSLGIYILTRFGLLFKDSIEKSRENHNYDYGYRDIAKLNNLEERIFIMDKYNLLNEVFIGKKPMEKLFGLWKQFHEFITNKEELPYKEKFYKDLLKELNSKFGFDDDSMIIINGDNVINALTFPAYFTYNALRKERNLFLITNDSIKLNPEHKVKTFIYFYRGLILRTTPEESFSVLLHEIGHSFNQVALQAAIYEKQFELNHFQLMLKDLINKFVKIMPLPIQKLLATDPYYEDYKGQLNEWWKKAIDDEKEYKKLEKIYQDSIERTKNKDNTKVFFPAIYGLFLLPFNLIQYPLNKLLFKKHAEVQGDHGYGYGKFGTLEREFNADNFASIFGYGTELASTMPKLSDDYNKLNTGSYISTKLLRITVLVSRLDITTHPSEYARMVSLIKHCEFELKNNTSLSKQQKDILQKQIDDVNKLINDTIQFYTDVNKNPLSVRIYHNICKDLINKFGSDREKNDYNYGYDKLAQKNK